MSEFMDIDGPEFIADVNNQIAHYRAASVHNTALNDAYSQYINDIQMSQEIPLGNFNEIAVLDTNFLLSKLGYLDTLLQIANENPGSLLLILPWIVIKELDGLKEGDREVSITARKAMRFLELKLGEKSLSLKGQKMNETLERDIMKKSGVKNDDRILDCCMYFQYNSSKQISLLSNDRNLAIKVMVHGIESVSAESTPKMEALLNRAARHSSPILANHYTTKAKPYIKPTEDYGMDIDDYHYTKYTERVVEEDFDMMIDDDYVQEKPALILDAGTEASKWAKASSAPTYSRLRVEEGPAYLDGDPTLTAPKRPFRPEHVSYSWAREKFNS